MLKSKKRIGVLFVAALTLLVFGVAGFAQKHFMLAKAARPEAVGEGCNGWRRAIPAHSRIDVPVRRA